MNDYDKSCRAEIDQAEKAQSTGDYTQAKQLIEAAVRDAQQARSRRLWPQTLTRGGLIMSKSSQSADAEAYLHRAIAAYDQVSHENTVDAETVANGRAIALAALAELLRGQDRLADASNVYADFFATAPSNFNQQDRARVSEEYCEILRKLGHADAAEKIEVAEGLKDPDLNESNTFKSAFGSLQLNKVDEAASGFHLLQSVAERSNQPEWQRVAVHWLAVCALLRGDFKSAEKHCAESIELAKALSQTERKGLTAQALTILSIDALAQGKSARAHQFEAQATAADKKLTVDTYESIGSLCLKAKRYAQAEMFLSRALPLMASNRPDVRFKLMHQLASVQMMQKNRTAEAIETFNQMLPLTDSNQDRALIYHLLGGLYAQRADLAKSIDCARQSIALRQKMKLFPDLTTHTDMATIASCLAKQGKYKEAEEEWKSALADLTKVSAYADRPVTQTVLEGYRHQLADAYIADGKYSQAAPLLEEIMPYYSAGRDQQEYSHVLKQYADVLRQLHQDQRANELDITRASLQHF